MKVWRARDSISDGVWPNREVQTIMGEEGTKTWFYPDGDTRRDSQKRLFPIARHNSLVNGLCRSCYEITSCFLLQSMTSAGLKGFGPRYRNIKLMNTATSCSLCNFLSSLVHSTAKHGGLQPGINSECTLHVSTFSNVFFDVQDRDWFSDCDPVVFYVSPLYSLGSKALEWALRLDLCFMPLPEDSSGTFARELSPQADLSVVREWIQHCDNGHTHPDCNPTCNFYLPGFTVIDCETRTLVSWSNSTPYVTLSYVWGTELAEAHGDDGRLPEMLPKLIDDAINVSSFLGYRYLWIDRYCIPQDDGAIKAGLIRNMDKIYSESALTIIASASERPSEGLAGASVARTDLPCSLWTGDLALTQVVTNLADEVEKSRWNTRGWTYQEGFLSNRRLLFTKSQCYFQCGEYWCTEGIRIPLDTLSRLSSPGQSRLSRVFPWVTHDRTVLNTVQLDRRKEREDFFVGRVREYMRRELTHDMDAYNAFAGVLNYLKRFSGEFLLGDILGLPIWNTDPGWSANGDAKDALLRSLAWGFNVPHNITRRTRSAEFGFGERRNGVPSWTWCGWKLANPSSRQIEWSGGWTDQENDTSAQTEIGFELEDGRVLQRTPTCNLKELLEMANNSGTTKVLRVRGWLSKLLVPSTCWNMSYDGEVQCGPYRIARGDVRYLSAFAERRGFPLTEEGYVLKAWFFSPLVFNVAEDDCRTEILVLVESTEAGTYERLDVLCPVKVEYFVTRPSINEMAARCSWELADFRLS